MDNLEEVARKVPRNGQEMIKAIGGRLRLAWADSVGKKVPDRIIEAMVKLDAVHTVNSIPDTQIETNTSAPLRCTPKRNDG